MKLKFLWLLFAFSVVAHGSVLTPDLSDLSALRPDSREAKAAHIAAELLARYHYRPLPIDEALSMRIFDQYLKKLDPQRRYFNQGDVDRLSIARSTIGLDMLHEDLNDSFAIFNVYRKRSLERFVFARSLLRVGFTASDLEGAACGAPNQIWPTTEAQAGDLWRARVKKDWLQLKLAGQDDKGIVEVLDRRYSNISKRIAKLSNDDAFLVYMNAFTLAIDPHTDYLKATQATVPHEGSTEIPKVGVGMVLSTDDDYTWIQELSVGGAALQSGQLQVGDYIVGIGQGQNGTIADVRGLNLEDIVGLIRGTSDTVVRLEIMTAEAGSLGRYKLVTLVRKAVDLQQQRAKYSIQTFSHGNTEHRVGVISLAAFYEDFEGKKRGATDYISAARDVASLIADLKKKQVDSILVDLRANKGGSLAQAVELAGLFIGNGPVLQARDATGAIQVMRAAQAETAWDRPMGVLIDHVSSAASEIFAAAIQDYGRGVVLGEPSFGAGTVQTFVDLDRIAKGNGPQLGQLKMTVAQVFRVNGEAIQVRGVVPDIVFPAAGDGRYSGESGFDNVIPWSEIKPANYAPVTELKSKIPILQSLHEARIRNDKDFKSELLGRGESARRVAPTPFRETPGDCGANANSAPVVLHTNGRDAVLQEAMRVLADEAVLASPQGANSAALPP